MVELVGVHKWYGDSHVLRGVDLTVPRGSVTVMLGPSGSGKSTALRCINQLEEIGAGSVRVEGELQGYREGTRNGKAALFRLHPRKIAVQRARVGMVFQRFNLFPHMTALGNVMEAPVQVLGKGKARGARARRRACSPASAWPTGSTTTRPSSPAASSSAWPSPGRSRWTPTSCCSTSPPRPSTPSWWARCSASCATWPPSGMTMIVVTHEIGFAREVADQVVFMADGVIVERGPVAQVIDAPTEQRTRDFLAHVL